AWIDRARECGLETRVIGRREIAEKAPGFEHGYPVGLFTPSDGRAEPQRAAPMIARHARALGVTVLDHCAVEGIETAAGAVSAVVTEKGRVETSTVVVAAGAWSSMFVRPLGIRLPQLKARVSMAKSDVALGGPDAALWIPGLCIRRCDDGRYSIEQGGQYIADIVPDNLRFFRDFLPSLLQQRGDVKLRLGRRFFRELGYENWWKKKGPSPFREERALHPVPSQAIVAGVKAMMNRHLSALGKAGVSETWGGYADVTPDAIPVISRVGRVPGLVLSTGYSGHGFGLSQGAARLTADIVLDRALPPEARHFDFQRFSARA
ncbi:MAG: FAD-binding oxidoreductase, partial [Hyphomicrobiales bacterium]